MEALRERFESKWVVGAVAIVAGIALGLIWGWVIQPVQWVNATPSDLRSDLQVDYVRMAIDSYSVNKDVDLAIDRYGALGTDAAEALSAAGQDPGEVSPTAIQNFRAVIEIFEEEAAVGGEPGSAPPPETDTGRIGGGALSYLLPVCGATVVLGVLLFLAILLRNRLSGDAEVEYEGESPFDAAEPMAIEGMDMGATVPTSETLATFRTIYTLGDDLYDDSFSIESAAGDFLGECGVGIGDIIGVGEPKKVSAYEVWLFDKNDIQTVTKVLMSRYAYNDEATRNRLAAKGDPVLAENGAVLTLETASLQVEARIVDMKYGEGTLPQESFFERITIELRALPKASPEAFAGALD